MTKSSTFRVFDTHAAADRALRAFEQAGFDMKKLSLIGKGSHGDEKPLGFYTVGDRIKAWGGAGTFWGGIWGLLIAPAVFFLPGVGVVALAGPVVAALVAALDGAAVVGVSAVAVALAHVGMPREQALKYEAALKADKYLLVVHGTAQDQATATRLLALSGGAVAL